MNSHVIDVIEKDIYDVCNAFDVLKTLSDKGIDVNDMINVLNKAITIVEFRIFYNL